MNGRRQRLAWIILFASFAICGGLALVAPVAFGALIQQATRSLPVTVQANQGTVGILQGDNETVALFAGDPPQNLNPNGSILTNNSDTALLLVHTPDEEQLLARIQVYGNTNLSLDQATSPRFTASSNEHSLEVTLTSGRAQITLPETGERPLVARLSVPQGQIVFQETGRYSVMTSNIETQVAVFQGQAIVEAGGNTIALETDQRGVLPTGRPLEGPVATERNLVRNGDFSRGLEEWLSLASNVEISGQPAVETAVDLESSEPNLIFERVGLGHVDTGLRQIINQDVADFESLRLLASMRIMNQTLGVCGEKGSECPFMIRIEYDDINGVEQTWQQGFYAVGSFGPDTPDVCVACPPPLNEHQQVPYEQLVFFESENLLERLGQLDILPRQIKTITLIVSGHEFETEVVDVALIAEE
jgi:hypothetical protein